MVKILREQTRQYASDETSAIRDAQVAQNIGEWRNIIKGAGEIATSVMNTQEKAKKEEEKKALEADTAMINTQINEKPRTLALEYNYNRITKDGVDPSTEEYKQELDKKIQEIYQPYIDQMTSEKGRNYLQAQGLNVTEKIKQSNIGKIAKNRQKAQAQAAFVGTVQNVNNDAKEFGKLGDWEGFKDATAEDTKALKKYAKANGIPEYQIDMANMLNFALGQAETDPELVLKTYGTKEDLRGIKSKESEDMLPKMAKEKVPAFIQRMFPGLIPEEVEGVSEKDQDKLFEKWYEQENIKQDSTQRRMDMLPEGAVKQVTDAFVMSKKQEQLALRENMKRLPKSSKEYKSFENRIDEIQEQIDNPDEYVADVMTEHIRKAVVPVAKEQYEKNRLLEKKMREANVKDTYTMALNPNTSVSLQTQMALSLGQPEVEDLFQMSVSDEEMHRAYDAYAQAKTDVLTREYATFEATQSTADKMYKFLSNPSTDDIEMMRDGFDLLSEMHKADLTQEQWQDMNNIMYGVFKDRAFADMAASVLEDNNKYFPDIPTIFRLGSQDIAPQEAPEAAGLPSNVLHKSTKSAVTTYLDRASLDISKETLGLLGKAAQLDTPEERAQAVSEIRNFVANEKQKAINFAMKNYGIDLEKLRANKKQFGQAFTQLGSRNVVEYVGDDPYSGKPMFRPLTDYTAISNARKRILEGLETSKKQSKTGEE